MKTRLVSIGNSWGLRLAKPLIDQLGFEDGVEMRVEAGALVVRPARAVREGWAEAAAKLVATGAAPVKVTMPTRFDAEKWEWR